MIQNEKYDHIYLVYHSMVILTKYDLKHVSVIILKVDSTWKSLKGH